MPLKLARSNPPVKKSVHEARRGLSTTREMNRADHSLHRVGQDGGLVRSAGVDLPLAQPDQLPQLKFTCHISQGMRTDDRSP